VIEVLGGLMAGCVFRPSLCPWDCPSQAGTSDKWVNRLYSKMKSAEFGGENPTQPFELSHFLFIFSPPGIRN